MALQSDQEFAPTQIARAVFPTAFRGYDQDAVRRYLSRLATALEDQLDDLVDRRLDQGIDLRDGFVGPERMEAPAHDRVEALEDEIHRLRRRNAELEDDLARALEDAGALLESERAAADSDEVEEGFDESRAIELLGKETARVLESARSAAADITKRAKNTAETMRTEAEQELAVARRDANALVAEKQAEAEALVAKVAGEAERTAARITEEAEQHRQMVLDESAKIMAEAESGAEAEQERAEGRARQIVADAETLRHQVVSELVADRRQAQSELDRIKASRDRLAMSLAVARAELDEVAEALEAATTPMPPRAGASDDTEADLAADAVEVERLVADLDAGAEPVGGSSPAAGGSDDPDDGFRVNDGSADDVDSGEAEAAADEDTSGGDAGDGAGRGRSVGGGRGGAEAGGGGSTGSTKRSGRGRSASKKARGSGSNRSGGGATTGTGPNDGSGGSGDGKGGGSSRSGSSRSGSSRSGSSRSGSSRSGKRRSKGGGAATKAKPSGRATGTVTDTPPEPDNPVGDADRATGADPDGLETAPSFDAGSNRFDELKGGTAEAAMIDTVEVDTEALIDSGTDGSEPAPADGATGSVDEPPSGAPGHDVPGARPGGLVTVVSADGRMVSDVDAGPAGSPDDEPIGGNEPTSSDPDPEGDPAPAPGPGPGPEPDADSDADPYAAAAEADASIRARSLVDGFTTIEVAETGRIAEAASDGGPDVEADSVTVRKSSSGDAVAPDLLITTVASRTASSQPDRTRGDLLTDHAFTGRLPKEFAARDLALSRSGPNFRRQLRRALNDDQSDVLDRIRAGRGQIKVEELPTFGDQIDRYLTPLRRGLAEVAQAGARAGGTGELSDSALDNLVRQLARYVVDKVRVPTIRVIEQAVDSDREKILEPIRTLYREFRNVGLADLADDALYEAFAIGLYDAIEPAVAVMWLIDPRCDPDPICEINHDRTDVVKGDVFPSGHVRPLSLPGCRCLVTAALY